MVWWMILFVMVNGCGQLNGLVSFQSFVPLISEDVDRTLWVDINGKLTNYSTKVAWESLRDNWPKVGWSNVVWFSQCTPKHAFILWLAVLNKLLTQDRMLVWHQRDVLKCSVCNSCVDSHQHLFFECGFSEKVWKEVRNKGSLIGGCHDLNSVINVIADGGNKNNIWSVVNKLLIAATVYFLWNERNKRMFQNVKRNEEEVISVIYKYMEDALQSLRVKRSSAVLKVANIWKMEVVKNKMVPANVI